MTKQTPDSAAGASRWEATGGGLVAARERLGQAAAQLLSGLRGNWTPRRCATRCSICTSSG